MPRIFKLINNNGIEIGRYQGKQPLQAAKKAFSGLCNNKQVALYENAEIEIKECTRGSKKKKYMYSCQRTKLRDPVRISIGHDREYTCHFDNIVHRIYI